MAHSDKYQDVLIRPGMEEHIDSHLLPMGTARKLVNLRTRQAARFEKRPGTASLGASGLAPAATARWVAEIASEPVVCVDDVAFGNLVAPNVYRKNSAGLWDRLGRHGVSVPERRFGVALAASGSSAFVADRGQEHTCAVVDGLLYLAFADVTAGTTVSIYQIDPDGIVLRKTSLSDAAEPRFVYANSVLYLVTREPGGSGTDIEVRTVSTNLTLSSETTLGSTLASATSRFDAAPVDGGTSWVIAYPESSIVMRIRRMTGTTSTVDDAVSTPAEATGIGITAFQGERCVVAYVSGGVLKALVATTSTLGNSGAFNVRSAAGNETYDGQCGVVRVDTDTHFIVAGGTDQDLVPTLSTVFAVTAKISTSAVTVGPIKHWHYLPTSKPWTYGAAGQRHVLVWAQNGAGSAAGQTQPKSLILDISAVYAFADAISYEHSGGYEGSALNLQRHVPEVASLGSGRRITVIPWDDPGPLSGIDVVVWSDAAPSESLAAAHRVTHESGGALYISGGALHECAEAADKDYSVQIPENGFPHYPAVTLNVGVATGGSLTAGQEYNYLALYRWQDSVGRVHRGAPSTAKATSPSPTGIWLTTRVRIATLSGSVKVGGMSGNPVAEVYRSWNGGPYYYVGSTGAIDSVSVNDVSTTYDDTSADTTVEANHVLYTDLGVLPTEPPSGARLMCQGGQRLFTVAWRENTVQFSKLYVATAPWEFVDDDTFRISVPSRITALAWMDGALVIFCASAIYLVTGDGPNDQGVGAFSDPRQLPAAVGADSPHVVEVAEGLMYKGGGTIWLLPRGFGPPQPDGDSIQETLGRFPHLRAAFKAANADDDCTHFVLASSDLPEASTYVAVRDNRFGSWSLDDIDGEVGAAAAVDGKFTWLLPQWSATTHVPARQFGVSQYQDYTAQGASTWIEQRIEFGDWRPFGVLGQGRLQRVGVLGAFNGSANGPPLNAVFTIDESVQVVQQIAVNGSGNGAFFREFVPAQQAGTAFQLTIYDSQPSTFVPSHVINAFGIEIEPEPGLRRPNVGERV